ncbi:long-chain-fatty-acid--CoA ligase [Cupriavidus agavae]|uniref:Long-chain acyl-CoA synthetase n=1 Tax=Cupriavidus agavae TaxID=1001822 RepID=A0A4Q7RZH6_9BURK|nr:long-chain-fatty-acid--CoA ligase [Cupriavidus agavae]RZT39253.1 long-chain acyl-CoA synthetase [Cupriavidus agavae]
MYLTQGLHRCMQQTPDDRATVFQGRTQTFRTLHGRVSRLAGALQAQGMAPGDRVSMLALNSDRYIEYMLAVWWGGGVLNPVNIRWSVPEIVYSLDDCDTGILIVDDQFLPMVPGILAGARRPPCVIHAGEQRAPDGLLGYEALIAAATPVPDAFRGGNDLASIMYTGGTTGKPKGVMQSHLNLWASAVSRMAQYREGSGAFVSLQVAPLFHTAAMARAVGHIVMGDVQVIQPGFVPAAVLAAVEQEKIEELLLVPTMLQALLADPAFGRHDLSSLRRISYGASPISAGLLDRALAALPDIDFFHAYGMTEASPLITVNPPGNHRHAGRQSGLYRSAGRASAGVTMRIVDPEGNEVPRHTVGEIIVRGANVFSGYWNRPKETAEALRDGWLYTGDGGYMDDEGYLFIVDRLKDMIVTGGENVYSAEVESVLSLHPDVASCAVIGIPDADWGEAVHAVVVPHAGRNPDEAALREHCRAALAHYKCPRSIEFRADLPLSAAGKILKRDLRDAYWRGQARQVG